MLVLFGASLRSHVIEISLPAPCHVPKMLRRLPRRHLTVLCIRWRIVKLQRLTSCAALFVFTAQSSMHHYMENVIGRTEASCASPHVCFSVLVCVNKQPEEFKVKLQREAAAAAAARCSRSRRSSGSATPPVCLLHHCLTD